MMMALRSVFGLIFASQVVVQVYGLTQTYCSNENAGIFMFEDQFQSNGLCSDTCRGKSYEFAIVQGFSCWCSNNAPSSDVSVSSCNDVCPGFGSESCGNADSDLYGYIYLGSGDAPSVGSGPSASSASPKASSFSGSSSISSTLASSSVQTSTSTSLSSTSSATSATSATSSTSSASSTSSKQSTDVSTSTAANVPSDVSRSPSSGPISTFKPSVSVIYSVETITAIPSTSNEGTAEIVTTRVITTVYSTPSTALSSSTSNGNSSSADNGNNSDGSNRKSSGFWHSPGKVGGTFAVVGIVAVSLFVILLVFLLKYRRNKEKKDFERNYDEVIRTAPGPHSSSSSFSHDKKAPFVYADEKGILNPPPSNNTQSPGSTNLPKTQPSEDSDPVMLDQRLDPQHLMTQWDNNGGSRLSLADDVDYSRKVLRVINE